MISVSFASEEYAKGTYMIYKGSNDSDGKDLSEVCIGTRLHSSCVVVLTCLIDAG